jgi:putative CocE/NonD family hydrolase
MAEQPANDVQIERDLAVVLADGTRLSGDLYRPAHGQAGPVLVSYYPYRKDDIIGSLFEGCRIRLCKRGYASVFVDMAGTGASEGAWRCFELSSEGRDFAEVIEWAAAQDWCDGNVGAWGVSYGGMNALAAAAYRPPHLRAIMAAYATDDVHRDSIARSGCNTMLGRYAWAAHMVALSLCPPTLQDPGGRWRRIWHQRLQRLADGQPPAVSWQAHPEPDAYWQSRQVDATAIDVPTMLIGGWADTYKDAMIRVFGEVRGPKRLVMGPWLHVLPHLSEADPYDWIADMADWWDTHLRPGSEPRSGQEAPVVFFAEGEGWRAARNWPPDGVSQMRLFLAGHRLAAGLPSQPGLRHYRADPTVGIAGGMWDPFGTGNGWPEEQSIDDVRSLTFTSDPLPESLLIAGAPEADLYVTVPDGNEAYVVARLSVVGPGERSTLITAGWCRIPARPQVIVGDAGDGADAGVPLNATTISLGPTAFVLPAGARVRLSVACSDFPRMWPTSSNPELVLGFGPGSASTLWVPVGRAGDRTDVPAAITRPPEGPDSGWVTADEPAFSLSHDKVTHEVAVTFGARSRLRSPSGADMELDEEYTARVQADRPDGAAVLARIGVGLRMPAGERVTVNLRSRSSRRASVVEANVTMDGVTVLNQSWAGHDTITETV